jgi:hypothetical protein
VPGPNSQPKGGKSKAAMTDRPAFRGVSPVRKTSEMPKGVRKPTAKLERRQRSYDDSLNGKTGFRRPGSMNLRHG